MNNLRNEKKESPLSSSIFGVLKERSSKFPILACFFLLFLSFRSLFLPTSRDSNQQRNVLIGDAEDASRAGTLDAPARAFEEPSLEGTSGARCGRAPCRRGCRRLRRAFLGREEEAHRGEAQEGRARVRGDWVEEDRRRKVEGGAIQIKRRKERANEARSLKTSTSLRPRPLLHQNQLHYPPPTPAPPPGPSLRPPPLPTAAKPPPQQITMQSRSGRGGPRPLSGRR